ncbi:IS3 family transposase [Clostridium nigeriense]
MYQHFFEDKESLFNAIHVYINWYNNEKIQIVLKKRTSIDVRCAA